MINPKTVIGFQNLAFDKKGKENKMLSQILPFWNAERMEVDKKIVQIRLYFFEATLLTPSL